MALLKNPSFQAWAVLGLASQAAYDNLKTTLTNFLTSHPALEFIDEDQARTALGGPVAPAVDPENPTAAELGRQRIWNHLKSDVGLK